MPKPRKSYAQAELTGSLAVNKGRFEDRKSAPPTTGEIGPAPAYFDAELQSIWQEVIGSIPAGVAGSADRFVTEMAARLLCQFRTDPFMPASKVAILTNVLSRLGLDPQARTRLQLDKPTEQKETNTFKRFMNAARNAPSEIIH